MGLSIDRENTISNLETNIRWIESTERHQFPGRGNVTMAMRDALELLKEQEPQTVIFDRQCEVEPGRWERKGFCPKCHQVVLWMVNREYCGFCGQAVKWE